MSTERCSKMSDDDRECPLQMMSAPRRFGDKFMELSSMHLELAHVYEDLAILCAELIVASVSEYDHPAVVSKLPENVIPFPRPEED